MVITLLRSETDIEDRRGRRGREEGEEVERRERRERRETEREAGDRLRRIVGRL